MSPVPGDSQNSARHVMAWYEAQVLASDFLTNHTLPPVRPAYITECDRFSA